MNIQNPRFLPSKYEDRERMKKIQVEIGEKTIFHNETGNITTVAGIDQVFTEKYVVTKIVVMGDAISSKR